MKGKLHYSGENGAFHLITYTENPEIDLPGSNSDPVSKVCEN